MAPLSHRLANNAGTRRSRFRRGARRSRFASALVAVATGTVLSGAVLSGAGCASSEPPPGYEFRGWPALPELRLDSAAPPPLPATGEVGRGGLLYHRRGQSLESLRLLTEDGRHFSLPYPPPGEGRQGTLLATLSPDGRWLGLRAAEYDRDPRYRVRDLQGAANLVLEGSPVAWSANARYLLLRRSDDDLVVLEPGTGQTTTADVAPDARHLVTAVSPDGSPISHRVAEGTETHELQIGTHAPIRLTFAPSPEYECWCPLGLVRMSPDGRVFTIQLRHRGGLSAETGEKVPTSVDPQDRFVTYDSVTGAEVSRFTAYGELVADTGAGLLLRSEIPGGEGLILIDRNSRSGNSGTGLPPGAKVALPGEIYYDGE